MSALAKRRGQALAALAIAGVLLVAGLAATFLEQSSAVSGAPPATLTPLLAAAPESVAEISVTTSTETFQIRRTLEGWVLASHDDYEADADLASRLVEAVAGLEPVGMRTRLARRHAALSLGNPENGGNATRVTLLDHNQRQLADLLIGRQRPDGQIYVRQADDGQTWLAGGYLPEFASAADWMQLEFLSLGREAIREACIMPEDGLAYCLERRLLSSPSFDLVSPSGWTLVSPGAGDGVATVLGRLRFRDVRPLRDVRGPDIAGHRVTTINGLEVTLSIRQADNRYWAHIVAVAHSDAARPDAIRLNERADRFAFALSELSLDRLIRPLPDIAIQDSGEDRP